MPICDSDLTGIFPGLFRFAGSRPLPGSSLRCGGCRIKTARNSAKQPAWLLGIQIMLCVTANHLGRASEIFAGTPAAIRNQLVPAPRLPDDFPPSAPLVIAALDGGTSSNLGRMPPEPSRPHRATRYPGHHRPLECHRAIRLAAIAGAAVEDSPSGGDVDAAASQEEVEQEFPNWNPDGAACGRSLASRRSIDC